MFNIYGIGKGDFMNTNEERITRSLKKEDVTKAITVKADSMLREKYKQMFENKYLNSVQVIDIQTAYNDYKKLHDDLYEMAKDFACKVFPISSSTDILQLVKKKNIRKACGKKHIFVEHSFLSISKIGAGLSCFLGIANIICSFIFGANYIFPIGTVLGVLGVCLLATLMLTAQQTRIYDANLLEKLMSLDEDELIEIFSCLKEKKSPLRDEGCFFVENFSKLDKLCRSCVIAYFRNKEDKPQIWCIFDYIFENSLKIEDGVSFESYRLMPLSYEDKEALYKKYNLQSAIAKEYLNCIGVDILCGSKTDIVNDKFEAHSRKYIKSKIESMKKEYDPTGNLTRLFYCLVYMSSKYKYSFTVNQIISLVQNEECADENLQAIICNARSKVIINDIGNTAQIDLFINKITDILEEYCFTEESRGNRKYKFAYDILKCFQEEMGSVYPDEESVKRWVLVKLISNKDMFQMDRYFFDCCNLLVMSDFLEDDEFCILSSYLIKVMNDSCCWSYTGCILNRLRNLKESSLKQYLDMDAVKRAAVNYLFYVSDNESIQHAMYFLVDIEGGEVSLDDFSLDDHMTWIPKIEKHSNELAGYFKLLYKVFGAVVLSSLEIGKKYQNIVVESFSEQDNVCEMFRKLLFHCIFRLNNSILQIFCYDLEKAIVQHLSQIKGSVEANEFVFIVTEMLLWIQSETNKEKDRTSRNINIGMLLETSNYNLLYFVYGLLNIALVKDGEVVYRNKNSYLDFISQSIFYFRIKAHAEGITKYINSLLNGRQSMNLRLNLAIGLLNKPTPCRDVLQNFIIENMDKAVSLFLMQLEYQSTEQLEDYIALLLLYNVNLKCKEFKEQIFGQVFEQIARPECVNGAKLEKYLHIILDEQCSEDDMKDFMNIVDEINQLESPDFAIWVLYGYYKINKEMVERIPHIIPGILTGCSINISNIMISEYLLNHNYYECNRNILNLYLDTMRDKACPSETDSRIYLKIIDKYAEDNSNIKDQELVTYNYMLSLYLYYEALNLSEQRESVGILLRDTMEFILSLIKGLQMMGMKTEIKNSHFCSMLCNRRPERNQEAEREIIKTFVYCSPFIDTYGKKYLSEDYLEMILYMRAFPDVCTQMVIQANEDCMEMIKQKHILYLVEVLLKCLDCPEYAELNTRGFDEQSLRRVKEILIERYNRSY